MLGSQKAATCFKAALFANSNTRNETWCWRRALFHDSSPFSFYIVYASSQDTRITHRDNIDIPLIDISIPNVNADTPMCVHAYAHRCGVGNEGKPCVSEESLRASWRRKYNARELYLWNYDSAKWF